jgi:hypothetical protein
MKLFRWIVYAFWFILSVQTAQAQTNVNLFERPLREVGITDEFTIPLGNRLGTFVRFVYVVCGLLSLVGIFRIFSQWQLGDKEVTGALWRWGLSIVTVLLLVTLLGELADNNVTGPAAISKTAFSR